MCLVFAFPEPVFADCCHEGVSTITTFYPKNQHSRISLVQQLCWKGDFVTVSFAFVHTCIHTCVCVYLCICNYMCIYKYVSAGPLSGQILSILTALPFPLPSFHLCVLFTPTLLPGTHFLHQQKVMSSPLELLSKTTASSTCFLETSAAFCQLVDISKSGHSAVLFYAVFTIFQFSLKSLLRKSFVLCGS